MNNNSKVLSLVLTAAVITGFCLPVMAQGYYGNQNYGQQYNQQNTNNGYNNNYNSNYNKNYSQNLPPLQGRVVTVPAGTYLSATTTNSLSSEFLMVGDTVSVMLNSGLMFGGSEVIPPNSIIEGNVVLAEKAGFTGKNGKLRIHFTNAITPNGQRIPLSGKIATADGTGLLVGGTNMSRVGNAVKQGAVGAGVGALFGTIFGPLSGGHVGRGAVYGTAVGGGLGLGKSLIDKGNEAMLPANNRIDIILEQPLTTSPSY
jgi:hypothetical protein